MKITMLSVVVSFGNLKSSKKRRKEPPDKVVIINFMSLDKEEFNRMKNGLKVDNAKNGVENFISRFRIVVVRDIYYDVISDVSYDASEDVEEEVMLLQFCRNFVSTFNHSPKFVKS
jgi:hypothetical protein